MQADEIRRGTMVDGRRVAAMSRGMLSGRRVVTVQFEQATTSRSGKRRNGLSAPVTYTLGRPVPGTRPMTTWAMPAGPVGSTPGATLNGGWYGDSDDGGRDARTDRHSRMINSLAYAR